VGVESSGMRERSDVKLIRIFHRDFGFVGNRFGHDQRLLQITETIRLSLQSEVDLDQ
jgi:hypothetical protein